MANFLEQPRQFNPYIQQIPLDIYATVGLQRQAQYEAGVQRASGYMDALSGLNVARQVDSDYLQGRVSELTSRVNQVASADWSNPALVSQVGKLAGMISSDKVIRNAVIGTQKYLKDEADIQEAKKTGGKWAPENEWILRKEMASWLGDTRPGATYNTAGYKPFVDVSAEVIKMWKDANPDSVLTQRPNGDFYAYQVVNNERQGTDGRTLVETSVKELRPDEIAEQINALLTGEQREQLAITGLYQYRNVNDTNGLNKLVDSHYQKTENYYQKLLDNEKLELSLQAGDPKRIAEVKERISQIEKKQKEFTSDKTSLKKGGIPNPDGLKSSLYFEDWVNGISRMLGYSQVSTKIVDNPSYQAMLDEFKIWADLQKAASQKSSSKSSGKKSGSDDDDDEPKWSAATATVLPLSEQDRAAITLKSFSERLAGVGAQMDQAMLQLLYRQFGDSYVTRTVKDLNKDGISEDVYTLRKGKEKEAAMVQAQWWDAYKKGESGLDITIRETLSDTDEKRLVATRLAAVIAGLDTKGTEFAKSSPRYQEYKKASDIFNRQPAVNLYGVTISPADVKAYKKLRLATVQSTASAGTGAPGGVYYPEPDEKTLSEHGISKGKYEVLRKAESLSNTIEGQHFNRMNDLYATALAPEKDVLKQKENYVNEEIKKYAGIFNEVALTLPSSKPEQMRSIANFVSTLAANVRETGMGGPTNWKRVREMIGEEHAKGTSYSYVQDRDGNLHIRISNPDVDKNTPEQILVDTQTARINNFSVPDYLSSTRSLLELGENLRTGSTFEESIPTSNERTGKYQVRHEVENFNGRYKVKLYVSDTKDSNIKAREIPINTVLFPDWTALSNFLQFDVNEQFISSLLAADSKGTTSSNNVTPQSSIFSTNPLLRQFGITPP